MLEKINQEILNARRAGLKERVGALNLFKAELINNDKAHNKKPELSVAKTYVKRLEKAAKAFPPGNPQREAINNEITIVNEFLPQQITDTELEKIVLHVLSKVDRTSDKPSGKVIGITMKSVVGECDGARIRNMIEKHW